MTELPTPRAARLRPPSWRDTRLVVGVLLILGSMVLGVRVVAAADDTVPVWAASADLSVGDALDGDALQPVRVRLAEVDAGYLSARTPPPSGARLTRSVGAGELVPRSAVGTAGDIDRSPVTVPLDQGTTEGIARGARVDVWVSRASAEGDRGYDPPQRLVAGAEVSDLATDDTGFGPSRGARSVQVLLEEEQLRSVLDARANDDRLAVVVVAGPGG